MIVVHPLTEARFADLETLFGTRGACGGCWCMWWRLPRKDFVANKGEGNRRALKQLVATGRVLGLLAYDECTPVGWCAIEPRENYPSLARSRVLAPVDDRPVWAITCFFTARSHRRAGLTVVLLEAAADYVRARGGGILEGYPVLPDVGSTSVSFAWTGFLPAFEKAGFREVVRRSPSRPIVRRTVRPASRRSVTAPASLARRVPRAPGTTRTSR